MQTYKSLILIATLLGTTALSGCVSQQYEADVAEFRAIQQQLNATITEQQQQLVQLNQQLDTMSQQDQANSAQLSQVLRSQDRAMKSLPKLAARVCPPAPVPKCPEDTRISGKMVLGQVEEIWLAQAEQYFVARIDSGATTSSINAQEQTLFERDGEQWARFAITDPGSGELRYLEAPVTRYVRIFQSTMADGGERRPVVSLELGIGSRLISSEFTLADRSQMDFQVLIGRSFLIDQAVVDVSRKHFQPRYRVKQSRVSQSSKAKSSAKTQPAKPDDKPAEVKADNSTPPAKADTQ